MDSTEIMNFVWPLVQTLVWAFFIISLTAGLGYYMFVIRRRRVWIVDVYEKKSGGKTHLVDKDKIVEKKIKGGISLFILKKKNIEVLPPPSTITHRYRNKEYVSYLRQDNEYIPVTESIENYGENDKKGFFKNINKSLKEIRNSKSEYIERKYIYSPLTKNLCSNIIFKPMDYDVNLLRITAQEARDRAYQDKQSFLQKWGSLIGIAVVACLLIVALYLSYDFAQNVIGQALGAADRVANPLNTIADKLGGSAPPS